MNTTNKSLIDDFDLDLTEEKNGAAKNQNSIQEPKSEAKKIKVSLEFEAKTLDEIKVLTMLGMYESKEEFIWAAVTEKKDEVMNRLKTAVKKK